MRKKLNEFTEKTGKPSMLYAFENPFEEPEQPEITEVDVKRSGCGNLCNF